jgi:hypothetical protein
LFGSGTTKIDQDKAKILSDMLFGDRPINEWPSGESSDGEPWESFIAARSALHSGNIADAVERWQFITNLPDLESRHYAQAWNILRGQGVSPAPDVAKQVRGMVLEVEMDGGADLLAAYYQNSLIRPRANILWRPWESSVAEIFAVLANA